MKKILLTFAALSLFSLPFAQDFGHGDGDFGGGDFFGGFDDAASSVTISGEVGASARAWLGTEARQSERNTRKGYTRDTRGYDKFHDLSRSETEGSVHADIGLDYAGESTDAMIRIKLDSSTIKDFPEDVIDEAAVSGNFRDGQILLKAGKFKEVWGKGDKIHVLDNFNANDYTDFIFPDYIDRRIGEVMLKATANLSWDYNLKLEGILTPMMTADRFASSGMLVPYRQRKLEDTMRKILKARADSDSDIVQAVMSLSDFSTDGLYEDNIRSLKYGQAGARLTGTFGGFDLGASYYYGHYKQPSANLERTILYEAGLGSVSDALPSLSYDRLQVFGLEAAFVLWKLNTRWEAAYNLTEDTAGDNPWIKNNSVSWVAGFDIDLPLHNLNLNVQETGSVILNGRKIKDMGRGIRVGGATIPWSAIGANHDVDYNSDGKYTRNKLIVLLSDKWLNERLTTEIQGIYVFECGEFMVAPKIEYDISEGLTLTGRAVYLYSNNENGEFYNFTRESVHHDKAFAEFGVRYQF